MLSDKDYFLFSGTAYVHGLKYVSGDFVIILDADLSHHVRSGYSVVIFIGTWSCLSSWNTGRKVDMIPLKIMLC